MRRALVVVLLVSCAPRKNPAVTPETVAPSPVASMSTPVNGPAPRDATLVVPCAPSSAEAVSARRALDTLSPRIDTLGASESLAALASMASLACGFDAEASHVR